MSRPPRRQVRGPRSSSARELDRYLRERDETVPSFADRAGVERIVLQKLLAGQTLRTEIGTLVAIRDASDGRVSLEGWALDTVRWDEAGEAPECTGTDG